MPFAAELASAQGIKMGDAGKAFNEGVESAAKVEQARMQSEEIRQKIEDMKIDREVKINTYSDQLIARTMQSEGPMRKHAMKQLEAFNARNGRILGDGMKAMLDDPIGLQKARDESAKMWKIALEHPEFAPEAIRLQNNLNGSPDIIKWKDDFEAIKSFNETNAEKLKAALNRSRTQEKDIFGMHQAVSDDVAKINKEYDPLFSSADSARKLLDNYKIGSQISATFAGVIQQLRERKPSVTRESDLKMVEADSNLKWALNFLQSNTSVEGRKFTKQEIYGLRKIIDILEAPVKEDYKNAMTPNIEKIKMFGLNPTAILGQNTIKRLKDSYQKETPKQTGNLEEKLKNASKKYSREEINMNLKKSNLPELSVDDYNRLRKSP